ncbi:MAG: LPS assembly protein LptD [Gammaproteobacteria bacterium]|nr:LPS assembly protein LptD [Gammaproteobacteria bacterium]
MNRTHCTYTSLVLAAAMVIPWSKISSADETILSCPSPENKLGPVQLSVPSIRANSNAPVEIRADKAELSPNNTSRFHGNVTLDQTGRHIQSQELVYRKQSDTLNASGEVAFKTAAGDIFSTEQLSYNLAENTGETGPVSFTLSREGRGSAQTLNFLENDRLLLSKVKFTTCPPEKESWYLGVSRLDLDKQQDIGKAYHALVTFQHVPIFYWPYLDFPLSGQRKSGFLAPTFGSSDKSGSSLATPWYWNIAPAFDDTITPRYFTDRGTQLGNEFRYIGRKFSGELNAEALPDDRLFQQDRAAGNYRHQQALGNNWSMKLDAAWVSDNQYLDDFSDSLAVVGQSHLKREALLHYRGTDWSFGAHALSYQTIDTTLLPDELPYEMLPQLRLATIQHENPNAINVDLESEWTAFRRDQSIIGDRVRVHPEISVPWRTSYSFAIPKVGTYYWAYDLSETAAAQRPVGFETHTEEAVPYFALDAGLFFDRPFLWQQRRYIQTLEPRVFYVKVPFRNQDGLPDFDTGLPDLRFAQLFQVNRFVGGDRVGDTNQVALALSTRILDKETSSERFRASLGQIYYFEDRQVNLPPATIDTQKSDLIAETTMLLRNRIFWQTNVRWDPYSETTREVQTYFQYQPTERAILNAGYLRTESPIESRQEQSDISFQAPLGNRWTVIGRQNYSINTRENLESYAGLAHHSCCWTLRLFGNRRLSIGNGQVNSVQLQLELTGLSHIGNIPESPLEQSLFSGL